MCYPVCGMVQIKELYPKQTWLSKPTDYTVNHIEGGVRCTKPNDYTGNYIEGGVTCTKPNDYS